MRMLQYKKIVLNGFTLFAVLLFLQIFALFGLYGMFAVKFLLNNTQERSHEQMYKIISNIILEKLDYYFLTHVPTCFIPITATALLITNDNTWWLKNSCHAKIANYSYDYVVEWLDKDACAHIIKRGKDNSFAEYYRITLRFWPNDLRAAKIILQSVIVKENHEPLICSGIQHDIKLGRQMQRELLLMD